MRSVYVCKIAFEHWKSDIFSLFKAFVPSSLIELLKYSSGKVLLDIRGQKLAQVEFSEIIREHPDALERAFQDVDDYVHMLPI